VKGELPSLTNLLKQRRSALRSHRARASPRRKRQHLRQRGVAAGRGMLHGGAHAFGTKSSCRRTARAAWRHLLISVPGSLAQDAVG